MPPRPTPPSAGLPRFLREHWGIVLVTLLAIIPLFADLGRDYLWADEGDTAVLASSIVKYGVPKAWDGRTFTDSDFGERLNKDMVMVSHPWLQYYLAAGSFLCFGETSFAARFPFALCALLTLPVLYVLILRLTADRRAGLAACILLLFAMQFILFARQCRNYAPNMLLVCVLLLAFFSLKNLRTSLVFAAVGILLFHCHPGGMAPLAALGILTLVYRPLFPLRKWYWLAAPLMAVFILPWLWWARAGYAQNSTLLRDWKLVAPRLTQFFIEVASVTPALGVVYLFVLLWFLHYRREQRTQPQKFSFRYGRTLSFGLFSAGERSLLVVVGAVFIFYAILVTLTQSRSEMFSFGIRYVSPVLPLMMALMGVLICRISLRRNPVWLLLVLTFALTRLGSLSMWSFVQEEQRTRFDGTGFASLHVPTPRGWMAKIFKTTYLTYYAGLGKDNLGTVGHISRFLNTIAQKDDILITNYEWEPIYFHTRLPQGLKMMPHYPYYPVAKGHNLPNYVFSVEGVRWIVWRWGWNGYRDYNWQVLESALKQSGARITQVASVPETTWENRDNVHFRRYPGDQYRFGWFPEEQEPDADIFRVDWPSYMTMPKPPG